MARLQDECKPQVIKKDGKSQIVMSEAFKVLRRLHKVKFNVNHRGKMGDPKVYTIKAVIWNSAQYGTEGAHSKTITFDKKNRDNGTTKRITIFQYFLEQYNIRLQYPNLPILETTKGALFPFEVCNIASHQRYLFKLDPQQASNIFPLLRLITTHADLI